MAREDIDAQTLLRALVPSFPFPVAYKVPGDAKGTARWTVLRADLTEHERTVLDRACSVFDDPPPPPLPPSAEDDAADEDGSGEVEGAGRRVPEDPRWRAHVIALFRGFGRSLESLGPWEAFDAMCEGNRLVTCLRRSQLLDDLRKVNIKVVLDVASRPKPEEVAGLWYAMDACNIDPRAVCLPFAANPSLAFLVHCIVVHASGRFDESWTELVGDSAEVAGAHRVPFTLRAFAFRPQRSDECLKKEIEIVRSDNSVFASKPVQFHHRIGALVCAFTANAIAHNVSPRTGEDITSEAVLSRMLLGAFAIYRAYREVALRHFLLDMSIRLPRVPPPANEVKTSPGLPWGHESFCAAPRFNGVAVETLRDSPF